MTKFTTHVFDIENDKVEKYLPAILKLEKECFPPSWQYDNAEGEYRKNLKSKSDINVFLLEGNNIVGYLLAVPHNSVIDELRPHDKELSLRDGCYYVETIQILSDFTGRGGLRNLVTSLFFEAERRRVRRFSIHARLSNDLNKKIERIVGEKNITRHRLIESWYFGGGEKYSYLEWAL